MNRVILREFLALACSRHSRRRCSGRKKFRLPLRVSLRWAGAALRRSDAFGTIRRRRALGQAGTVFSEAMQREAGYNGYPPTEPMFMILGQSAAAAVTRALDSGIAAQDVPYEKLRARLLADGQVLER